MAIQRTRVQESYEMNHPVKDNILHEVLGRVLQPRIDALVLNLQEAKSFTEQKDIPNTLGHINLSMEQADELRHQLSLILHESANYQPEKTTEKSFHYPASPLTNRELELLTLVKKGYTNKLIAEHLFISERTVKFHITSILSKLYASTRTEAVDIALKRGIISF
jgi:DNA-binding NarL/FixJ family response regulator